MSNTNQFDWVDFYKELAAKLLQYKNNRAELISKVLKIYETTGINLPTLEKDNKIVDIDPFTFFGLFNKSSMKEATVLDLTGCNVEEVLYYISNENPVFAMTGKDSAVLIVGYSSSQIFYFDPTTQVTSSLSYDRAQEWFENAGSVYLAYLD